METIVAYLYSLVTYSCFQFLDMWSTKMALSKLDIEKHEINPLLVKLKKRFGFNVSLFLMWALIANSVALFDALLIQSVFGLILLCYFFGLFHLLAVFNNLQIYFEVQFVGAETFEQNTEFLIQELAKQSPLGKIAMLLRLNLFNVFLSIFGVVTLFLSTQLLSVLQFRLTEPISLFLFYFPPMMILVLIMFFPMRVFGMFLIYRRRLGQSKSNNGRAQDNHSPMISLPVSVLESALNNAKANNAEYVQFSLTPKEDHGN